MIEWKNGIAKLTVPTPFPVGDVHTYLIKGDRLTLVDAGVKTKEAWELFKVQLAELGLTPTDIEQIILTHHHPDHVGFLDYMPSSLAVLAHPLNERWLNVSEDFIKVQEEFYTGLYRDFGIPQAYYEPTIESMNETLPFIPKRSLSGYLVEDDIPSGLEDWKVIEANGHAQGHIVLWREKDGVLIGGDVLLAHISPNPFLEPPHPGRLERSKSQLQLNESLKRLSQLPISRVLPGHGEDITDVNPLIDKRLKGQHKRAMQVKNMIELEPKTVFEICQRLFPTIYEKETGLTISETVAQLDYLLSLDEIQILEGEHPLLYKAK